MGNGNSIINLGDISKPATVLIEKISDAIGGIFKPYQIRRIAQAEADAEKIKEVARIEIDELQKRALNRFLREEAKKQINMEEITKKALPDVNDGAKPENIEDDWIINFFEKCRLISDEEMQSLWAKVLSGEANRPGRYSKRTVNFLSGLDKTDAILFSNLCSYACIYGNVMPLIYDVNHEIYNKNGINFGSLKHLDDIGLLSFENLSGYVLRRLPKEAPVHYYKTPYIIRFKKDKDNEFNIGQIILSKVGQELASICGAHPIHEFPEYLINKWISNGYEVYSPWPNIEFHTASFLKELDIT